MDTQAHLQVLKSRLQKQKTMDINGHVSDWTALLHYQSHNGDGLYAPMSHLQTYLEGEVSAYVAELSQEELRNLTQEAFEKK